MIIGCILYLIINDSTTFNGQYNLSGFLKVYLKKIDYLN